MILARIKPTETTKPENEPPQQSGQFSVKEKKYEHNGANVAILQLENKTDAAYTVTLTGKFKDASGNVIKTESQTFDGFPAKWSNYFVFLPGIKYDKMDIELSVKEYRKKTLAEHIKISGGAGTTRKRWMPSDGNGNVVYPTSPEEEAKSKKVVSLFFNVYDQVKNTYSEPLYVSDRSVFFDSNGDICAISSATAIAKIDPGDCSFGAFALTDVLWENADEYVVPTELQNVTGICALISVTE